MCEDTKATADAVEEWAPKKGTGKKPFHYEIDEGCFLNRREYTLYTELDPHGKPITDGRFDYSVWCTGDDQYEYGVLWDDAPEGAMKARFPFLTYVQLFCATGGEIAGYADGQVTRDLFVDPFHPEKGYDFEPLLRICRNIVRQGLKPYLKLGHVPVAFSDDFARSKKFRTNLRPPTDWNRYFKYLCDVMDGLKETFGEEELKTWRWGSFTEIDNEDWLRTADDSEEHTLQAAIRIYQCTTAAVEHALGEGAASIGPHFCQGRWDILRFLDACLHEVNPFSGRTGSPVSWVALSHYAWHPGNPSYSDHKELMRKIRERFGIRKFSHDEGNMLLGIDGLNLITTTYCAQPFAISYNAWNFKQDQDNGVESRYMWGFTTDSAVGWSGKFNSTCLIGVDYGFTNAYRLMSRLHGSLRQPVARGSLLLNKSDLVDGVIGYRPEEKKLQILVFNHNEDFYARTTENVTLRIVCGQSSRPVNLRRWQVDEDHGDFWKTWWEERGRNARYLQSAFDATYPLVLQDPDDVRYWEENEARYAQLARLPEPTGHPMEWDGRTLIIRDAVLHHGIVYYEIEGIETESDTAR